MNNARSSLIYKFDQKVRIIFTKQKYELSLQNKNCQLSHYWFCVSKNHPITSTSTPFHTFLIFVTGITRGARVKFLRFLGEFFVGCMFSFFV